MTFQSNRGKNGESGGSFFCLGEGWGHVRIKYNSKKNRCEVSRKHLEASMGKGGFISGRNVHEGGKKRQKYLR